MLLFFNILLRTSGKGLAGTTYSRLRNQKATFFTLISLYLQNFSVNRPDDEKEGKNHKLYSTCLKV